MLIYTTHITSRVRYILNIFFGDDITLTNNSEELIHCNDAKINYSDRRISAGEFWIHPHNFLFENDIKQQVTDCFEWNDLKVFFKTEGDIPFDIFAGSFYLITRYEEYLAHTKDVYGRYAHTNSLAFKENFLHLPLVNLWMKEFERSVKQKFSDFVFNFRPFTFLPTYDIDIAYSYLHRSLKDSAGSIFWSMVHNRWSVVKTRINVLREKQKDPFDTYDWLDALHEKYQLKPFYFFLLAEKRKLYDKNISPDNNAMKELIQRHAQKYTIGIHPSWQSGDDKNILKKEIELIRNISKKEITASRQHYIRMSLPETYRELIANGIREDYSMGYGSINGFRASVSTSFFWYDLKKEQEMNLKIYPFCYMEANSFFEQYYSADQAAVELQQYCDIVKSVNGELVTIFHNHFITEEKEWIAWRNMYNDFLKRNFA